MPLGAPTATDRAYSYDQADRLTQVQDHTGIPETNGTVPCETRTYSFDANGNRTGQSTIPSAGDGSCTRTGGTATTRAYDAADRPTTGADGIGTYSYDQLGRQTSIPAADAPHPNLGDISLGYYDTDTIRTINQGTLGSDGTQISYTLDFSQRRLAQITQNDTGTATLVRHYTDNADNPTWSVDTRAGTATTTRYNELINGDLGLTLTTTSGTTSAALDINTPRGDVAASGTLGGGMTGPGAMAAANVDSWSSFREYGAPQQTGSIVSSIGYAGLAEATCHCRPRPHTDGSPSVQPVFGPIYVN